MNARIVSRSVVALLSLGVVSITNHAGATPVTAALSTPPVAALSTLPAGKLTRVPTTKKPYAIGAHERVAGIFLVRPAQMGATMVTGSRDEVDRLIGKGKPVEEGEEDHSRDFCFSESRERRGMSPDEPLAKDWDPTMQPFLGLYSENEHVVAPIHLERVVEEGDGKATLQVTDAWVDATTRGARLINKAKVAMQLVATAPGGIHVYAARDEGRVQFILVEPRNTTRTWQGIVQVGMQGMSQSSCRHARATLTAERGSADTTTFIVTAELPPTESDKAAPDSGENEPNPAVEVARIRTRPLHVHASVSWTTQEKEPVVAVSMGWEARDRSNDTFRPRKVRFKK